MIRWSGPRLKHMTYVHNIHMRPTGLYAGLTSQITKKFNKSLPFKFLWCPINKYVHIKIMAYLYLCAYLEFFRDGVESKPTQNLALSWEIITK